jgi:hypothetical protein
MLDINIGDFVINNFKFRLGLNVNIDKNCVVATTRLPLDYPKTDLYEYTNTPLMLLDMMIYNKRDFEDFLTREKFSKLILDFTPTAKFVDFRFFQFMPKLHRKHMTYEESQQFRGFGKRCLRLLFTKLSQVMNLDLDTCVFIEVDGHITTPEEYKKRVEELSDKYDEQTIIKIIASEDKIKLSEYYNRNYGFVRITDNIENLRMISSISNII